MESGEGRHTILELPGSPGKLGLINFPEWRPFQKETSEKVINSDKKVYMIDAPTGSGKSLIGMAVSSKFPGTIYCCTTKTLQDQLTATFPDVPILKGRNNYPCLMDRHTEAAFPEITAEDCPRKFSEGSGGQDVKCQGRCPYLTAKKTAQNAPVCILNTSYLLAEANFVGQFSGRSMVVIDEADELEGELMRFVEITITQRQLERLHLSHPKFKTKWESWKEWAIENKPSIDNSITKFQREIEDPIRDRKMVRMVSGLKSLSWKMSQFITNVDEHWVYIEAQDKWTWKPIWVSGYAKGYLWDHGDRFVLMSATILSPIRLASNLGIEKGTWGYSLIPSQFPPDRRRVYYRPTADLSRKTREKEIQNIIHEIQSILDDNKGKKGLIHTVSYANAKYIMENIKDPRLISHNSFDRDATVKSFVASPNPLVLVSPSMDRGVDFKYELTEFIIILKIPFPDLSDKQISSRLYGSKDGNAWYAWMTACTIIQMSGRGMRAVDDRCKSYILDKQFDRFYGQHSDLFPDWWKESLEVE